LRAMFFTLLGRTEYKLNPRMRSVPVA
jgi:hypothetical protein